MAVRPNVVLLRDGQGGTENAAHRGGGFQNAASTARATTFSNSVVTQGYADLGLRPVRNLER